MLKTNAGADAPVGWICARCGASVAPVERTCPACAAIVSHPQAGTHVGPGVTEVMGRCDRCGRPVGIAPTGGGCPGHPMALA